jgi:putative NADH-flavin reductase
MAVRKILLLGATGGTGRELVSRAHAEGQEVTVLVRRRDRLGVDAGHVRVLVGDILDEGVDLPEVMRGQDAVVSALGVGNSLRSHGLIGRAVPRIVAAMENAGVSRFILTSAYGVGETMRDVPLLPRVVMTLLLRDLYADKKAGEAALRESSLDWTIVHPVTLTDGPRTGTCRAGQHLKLSGFPRISRADVAEFLLAQVGDRTFSRQDVLLGPAAAARER